MIPETNPYLRAESNRRSAIQMVAGGIAAGALFGVFYLWQFSPSLADFLASLAAGGAAGLVYGLAVALPRTRTKLQGFGIAAVSGGCGGIAWWLVARPALEFYWVAAIGAGIAVTLVLLAKLGLNF